LHCNKFNCEPGLTFNLFNNISSTHWRILRCSCAPPLPAAVATHILTYAFTASTTKVTHTLSVQFYLHFYSISYKQGCATFFIQLFIAHTEDPANVISRSQLSYQLYEYDTQCMKHVRVAEIPSVTETLQSYIQEIQSDVHQGACS